MLRYEHEHTGKIVDRLQRCKGYLSWAMLVSSLVLFGLPAACFGLFAFAALAGPMLGLALGGFFGLTVGYFTGTIFGTFMECAIDWMCQLLVAQGQQVAPFPEPDPADRWKLG